MHTVFLSSPFKRGVTQFINDKFDFILLRDFVETILEGTSGYLLYWNGKELVNGQDVPTDSTVYISFPLPGGKGGFGSMLRAIGAQIEKTTNREACRDLSGRRLRDINEEQRLKKWIAKKAEREAEKVRRRKERLERLKSQPKHNFFDFDYEKKISELPDRIDDALNEGIQKANKRPLESDDTTTSKKKRLWLEEDISESSSDSDQDYEKHSLDSILSGCSKERSEAGTSSALGLAECESHEASSSSNSVDFQTDEKTALDNKNNDSEEKCDKNETSTDGVQQSETTSPEIDEGCTTSVNLSTESAEESKNSTENKSRAEESNDDKQDAPIELEEFNDVSELESLGLERLKCALMSRGLKCGGSIHDRAQRLWTVKGLKFSEYPKNLLAKQKK